MRLPNVCTALADVSMGYLFVNAETGSSARFVCLCLASSSLYLSGMIWNDVFDVDRDRIERPERPLPRGVIGLARARRVAAVLWVVGIAAGWKASICPARDTLPASLEWRSGIVATFVGVAALSYDAIAKQTVWGPMLMGACRTGNVLLGGSFSDNTATAWLGWDASFWAVAIGLGVYVAGVTQFARSEARPAERLPLVLGIAVLLLGLLLLGVFPWLGEFATQQRALAFRPSFVWPGLLGLVSFPVLRRCAIACVNPNSRQIQSAVATAIRTLIVFDASLCLAVRPHWYYSAGILSLLLPMFLLRRTIAVT
jgi:4-hydroxybenzoate polyprenyltransferase